MLLEVDAGRPRQNQPLGWAQALEKHWETVFAGKFLSIHETDVVWQDPQGPR